MDRREMLSRAVTDCMREMYAKAQPSIDYDELIKKVKSGEVEDTNENPVYNRHYLSMQEFDYIREKWAEAYGLKPTWKPNIELLESYLNEGGSKDKYIPERMDKHGLVHPGYRSYEKVKPLVDQLADLVGEEKAKSAYKIVMDTINECKDFYSFDREYSDFCCSVALGASPTSNPNTVIKYWAERGITVEIEERNPLLFWEMDHYGDEFEEVMEDEYGKNWKKIWEDKWNAEVDEKERKKQEEWENFQKTYKPAPRFNAGDMIRTEGDPNVYHVGIVYEDHYTLRSETDDFEKSISKDITFEEAKNYYHTTESWEK